MTLTTILAMLAGALSALALSLPLLLATAAYETTYTDSSGARRAAFSIGNHDVDLCHGKADR